MRRSSSRTVGLVVALAALTVPLPDVGLAADDDGASAGRTTRSCRLAFRSDRSGAMDIWVLDRDGDRLRNLTADDNFDTQPSWSPSGNGIVFSTDTDTTGADLVAVRADGERRVQLTDDSSNEFQPAWSPNRNEIAFVSDRTGNEDIYVLDLRSGGQRQLTDSIAQDSFPQWSPDGRYVSFFSRRDGGNAELYVMNADGSAQRRLTETAASEFISTWSPDGRQLAYVRQDEAEQQIWVIDVSTTTARQLTFQPGTKQKPDWSPDGRLIAFHGTAAGTIDNEILTVYADGTGPVQRITTSPQFRQLPTRPDPAAHANCLQPPTGGTYVSNPSSRRAHLVTRPGLDPH